VSGHDARHPSDPEQDGRGGRTGAARIGRQRGPGAPGGPAERPEPPVDLNAFAELQATEALLDRLARRDPLDDDLDDPLAGLLAELTRDVDIETDASRRFRAVLAGRTAQDGQWRLEPPSTGPIPLVQGRAAAHRRDLDHPGGFVRQVIRALPVMGAAAGVLLAVAGGVVAAVTGDPMAPITGINSALNAPQTVSYERVQQQIQRAARAVSTGDSGRARQLIDNAKDGLDEVASPQKSELNEQISDVEQSLSTASPTAAPTPSAGRTPDQTAPVSAPTGTGTGSAPPTGTATATSTEPPPTSTATATQTPPDTASPTPTTAVSATSAP
jgi:hypothetical protein